MPNDPKTLTIYFHRNDGQSERVPLTHGTISDAASAIQAVFYISDGLYTRAEVYQGSELIETVENHSARAESILIQ